MSWVTKDQIRAAIGSVPVAKRPALIAKIQRQVQINMQPRVLAPVYPGQPGYPFPPGTSNYGRPFYPSGPGGYPPGWGPLGYVPTAYVSYPAPVYRVPLQTGVPAMYAVEDIIDDETFEDEGADSTEVDSW